MSEPITKACKRCGVHKTEAPEHFRYRFYPHLGKALYAHTCIPCTRQKLPPRPEGTKKCRKCGQYKPLDAHHFRPNGKPTPTGTPTFRPMCRMCEKKYHPPEVPEGMKWCRKCGKVKPFTLDYFYCIRKDEDKLSHTCKTCNKHAYVVIRNRDPQLYAEKRRDQERRRYERDPALFKLQRRASTATRRARKRAVAHAGNYTPSDIQRKLEEQGQRCYWCRKKLKLEGPGVFHIDHIWPLAKGGTNAANNVCCACPDCNASKSARTPMEFSGRLF